ncbi:cinnamyl-alcohol dehydrogenase, partial [Prunus dulcis]
ALGTDDVSIKITHCGVCYADVIWTRNQHGDSKYPVVPGHEIAGIVKEVGSNVQRFKVGDHMGVGTHVNSCRDCEYCNDSFNGVDVDGTIAKGGYSSHLSMKGMNSTYYPLASAAPLLCAGITVYASMGDWPWWPRSHGSEVWQKAFGLNVTIFSTSISKKEEALSQLGADNFVVSSDRNQMKVLVKSVDFIIDIAFGDHPFDPYMELLKTGGVRVLWWDSTVKSKSVLPTLILDIQEMIDFCASNGIHPMIEIIPIQSANEAIERLLKKCCNIPVCD